MPVLPVQRVLRSSACLLNTCLLSKRPATAGSPPSRPRGAGAVLPSGQGGAGSGRAKRRPATRLAWAVRWGTVRMLGTFLTEDSTVIPASVVRFVAEQLTLDDEHFAEYGVRVWSSLEGPRALFDRAVVWLVNNRVLLPGVTTLARMVAAVRSEENDRPHAALFEAAPYDLRTEMVRLLEVPEKKRVSELERLRLGPTRVSGKAMELALDRAREVRGLGAGAVDVGRVPAARMTGLARYGLTRRRRR
ncbi:DUF4158 domain-containing protein [Streptomyces sp. M19]